jgi:uncharacterized protein
MIVPDVNLMLYAHDLSSPFHTKAVSWWKDLVSGADTIGLAPLVIFAFVRICTNSRAYTNPMSPTEATGHVRLWLEQPAVQLLETGPGHVERSLKLLETIGTGGNLVTDAQLAALTIEYGAELHTNDADFARFPDLRWYNPLTGDRSRAIRRKAI